MKLKLLSVLFFLSVSPLPCLAEDIKADDIGEKITLVGRLGKPLGKIVEIECRGIPEPPRGRRTKHPYWKDSVEVTMVNGTRLKKPITIRFGSFVVGDVPIPKPGKSIRVVGYETGSFTGVPHEAFEHVPSIATIGYGFTTSFVALKEKKSPKGAKKRQTIRRGTKAK